MHEGISNSRIRQLMIYCQFQWSRISKLGLLGISQRVIRKLVTMMLAVILLPMSLILYFFNVRRFCVFSDRIGHLAVEPDALLKAQSLGLIKSRRWFILAPTHRVSNPHLMFYWQQYFTVFHSAISCYLLNAMTLWPFMRFEATIFINNSKGTQLAYEVNARWQGRAPILSLTKEDNFWGDEQFAKLGLPKGAWFVAVHAREGGFSPADEVLHSHRNGSIDKLIPAINEITKRGGWVVRLGDPTMKPLPNIPQVIDYAHHPLRSARLDIILCARAKFILGNSSGIFIVGTVFGVPSALANMIPFPTMGFLSQDIFMPKLFWLEKEKRYLNFNEIMSSPISTYRYASLYEKSNITVEENSAEDILILTVEMLDKLNGTFIETEADEQRESDFMKLMTPAHYAYGACSKVSCTFLRRYQDLLQ